MTEDFEVIIIGAGIAGLASALDLAHAGLRVAILEARDRIGGRIYTKRDPVTNAPIELGAEFIHGKPPEILDVLKKLGLHPVPASGEDWCVENGELSPCNLFSDLDQVLDRMSDRGSDESFLEFLQRCCSDLGKETRERALAYIEGFHAADPALISVHSLKRGLGAEEKIEGGRAFRPPGGYETLLNYLHNSLQAIAVPVLLNTVVQQIHWGDRGIELSAHTDDGHKNFSARRVLITLPLGVLQAAPELPGGVRFVPDLPDNKKSALARLAMGKVIRITLRFRHRFWEKLKPHNNSNTLAKMRFLFSQESWFPTWWTTFPERLPMIVGWAPYHSAAELSKADESLVFSSACERLRSLLHMGEQEIEQLIESASWHDWMKDPFTRGAYSYVKVGGESAQAELAAPVGTRLFFAGEATDTSGYHGTVHGAMASGKRAVKEILAAVRG